MNYELIFSVINLALTPAWIMLILSAWWSGARRLVHNGAYPIAYAIAFLGFGALAQIMPDPSAGISPTDIAGVKAVFFTRPETLLAAWTHFLLADLFIGAWIDRDAARRGVAQWLRIICLLLTYFSGPVGFIAYFLSRKLSGKGGFGLIET